MNVTVSTTILEEIIACAKSAYPQEACGLLIGHGTSVTRFVPMPNALSSETEYEIDPALLASTFRALREAGEDLVAVFHSHPRGAAAPSKQDLERAFYPQAAHIIVSLVELERPQVRSFRIIDGHAYEIEVHAIV